MVGAAGSEPATLPRTRRLPLTRSDPNKIRLRPQSCVLGLCLWRAYGETRCISRRRSASERWAIRSQDSTPTPIFHTIFHRQQDDAKVAPSLSSCPAATNPSRQHQSQQSSRQEQRDSAQQNVRPRGKVDVQSRSPGSPNNYSRHGSIISRMCSTI